VCAVIMTTKLNVCLCDSLFVYILFNDFSMTQIIQRRIKG
jgi:hypothetical protein